MELLSLTLRTSPLDPSVEVMSLEGVLDINSVADFEAMLSGLFEKGRFKIILNMEKLSYVSSAGYGVLLSVIKEVRKNGGDIKIVRVNPGLNHTSALLDIPGYFNVLNDENDAVYSFTEK